MDPPIGLILRHAASVVREDLQGFRVVVVNGPRQAGKTTLLRLMHSEIGGQFASLDDERELEAARHDPVSYIAAARRPFFIDGIQRAADPLLLTIKLAVDQDPVPGSFVLSGSARFLTVPTLSESLAGRAAVVDLLPFSMAERLERPANFVDTVFNDPASLAASRPDPLSRHEYMQLVCTGGFPGAVASPAPRTRGRWFASYLRTVISRDVRDIARIHRLDVLPRAVRLLAALTAQELNTSAIARDLGLDEDTARAYLPLLETVYLIHRLPAWSRNLVTKVVRRPKLHLIDSGLAAWLQRQSPEILARPGNASAGALLETFVVNEIAKLSGTAEEQVELLHFRERAGREIDCVIEATDGRAVAIEVKAASTVAGSDFGHLAFVRDKIGADFVAGVVFYTGDRPLPFGDRLVALPVSALWTSS